MLEGDETSACIIGLIPMGMASANACIAAGLSTYYTNTAALDFRRAHEWVAQQQAALDHHACAQGANTRRR
jgi:hypothetical protein